MKKMRLKVRGTPFSTLLLTFLCSNKRLQETQATAEVPLIEGGPMAWLRQRHGDWGVLGPPLRIPEGGFPTTDLFQTRARQLALLSRFALLRPSSGFTRA